ncbi:zinc-binding dehydrogenase [Candidatus Peregrinibacteria bacterium]|nr:zinc-binding dehydrogenase [Candidatus Peregrinibacteria bacterium]
MKASIFEGGEKPLVIKDIATPVPKKGEVLVKVAACGVCHTDLHYLDHGVKTAKSPPLVLGHEASGTIVGLNGEIGLREKDRVVIPAVLTCGFCRLCRLGRENICENMKMLGNHIDGAFAEFVAVSAKDCIKLPDEIPLDEACLIGDALSTPYHAVRNRAKVQPADKVVVIGCGGVGLGIIQFAKVVGARIIAIDISEEKLAMARELGAEDTINSSKVERLDKAIRDKFNGGSDIAFEAIGKPQTIEAAAKSIRIGGTLVIVGYCSEAVSMPANRIMFAELNVIGSLGARPVDYTNIVELVRKGSIRIKPIITGRFGLDDINKAFDKLREGKGIRSIVIP